MKTENQIIITIKVLLIICCFMSSTLAQNRVEQLKTVNNKNGMQSDNKWTKKEASKWYNSQEWLNGLQLKPHTSFDQEEFAKQYHSNKKGWDKAFAYMKETDLKSLTPGRHQIDGENVYVIAYSGDTGPVILGKLVQKTHAAACFVK